MTGAPAFDPAARYVRIMRERANGMVTFKFAVGEPALFVEMVMLDAQSAANRYRPTWGPAHEEFDASCTKIVMKDGYAQKDPRAYQRRGRSGRLRAIVPHPADQRSAPEGDRPHEKNVCRTVEPAGVSFVHST